MSNRCKLILVVGVGLIVILLATGCSAIAESWDGAIKPFVSGELGEPEATSIIAGYEGVMAGGGLVAVIAATLGYFRKKKD